MAWAAGFVDAVGWLVLLHVYTSHMTGNTASFARNIVNGQLEQIRRHGWPLLPFVAGLLYSAATTSIARRRGVHSSFAIALVTELVLLGSSIAVGTKYGLNRDASGPAPAVYYGTLSCLTAAMGIQTVTVTRVGGLRVYTTYLTGSLSKFAENAVQYALWFYDRTRGRFWNRIGKVLRVTPHIKHAHFAALTAGLWTGFFAGALCGSLAEQHYHLGALLFPMIVIAIAAATDLARPVAAADEAIERDSAH